MEETSRLSKAPSPLCPPFIHNPQRTALAHALRLCRGRNNTEKTTFETPRLSRVAVVEGEQRRREEKMEAGVWHKEKTDVQ